MRVLLMTPRFPYPPNKGDQTLAYHRIRTLSTRHEIVLLSFFERDVELAGLEHIGRHCRAIHTVRLRRMQSYWSVLRSGILSRTPLQILYYRSSEYQRTLDRLLSGGAFDVVHAFMLRLAPYLQGIEVPKVLELIDSMQLNTKRIAERAPWPTRLLYTEEHSRICSYEVAADALADRLIFVSEADKAMVPSSKSISLPLGVVADDVKPTRKPGRVVVFSGNMDYLPNVEAARWFASRVWGSIRSAVPDAEFRIVGRNPTRSVRALASHPGVHVTGSVPDMRQSLLQAHVAVAPMRSGSGMQNKVLEAMACGLPVVATALGLGSIAAIPDKDVLLADDPAEFASAVSGLLLSGGRREMIGSNGWAYVRAHHSWEQMSDRIDSIYRSIARAGGIRPVVSRPGS